MTKLFSENWFNSLYMDNTYLTTGKSAKEIFDISFKTQGLQFVDESKKSLKYHNKSVKVPLRRPGLKIIFSRCNLVELTPRKHDINIFVCH